MPRYQYITQMTKGAPFIRAFADAPSLAELNSRLAHVNKPVVKIFDLPTAKPCKRRVRISLRTKLTFMEQLEASCYLGMDFRTALGICLRTTPQRTRIGRQMAALIRDLRENVSRGMSFARAITLYPLVFDDVAVGLISAGEEGGTFNESLSNVRKIWARNEDLQHRLVIMLIYPAVVFAAAVGVVWLLMTRVVPQFIGVLSQMNVDLPLPTRILLNISRICSQYPWMILLAGAGLIVVLLRLPGIIRSTPRLHRLVLRIPILGHLLLLLMRASFSRTFAQLKHANAKTTRALLLCRDLSWNYHYRSAIARALVRVQAGEPLSAALEQDIDIFGEMVVNGLTFMEASGADSEGLFRLTSLLERQLDSYIAATRQILDPLLILFLGGVVGGIVFATFLPAMEILQRI
jgi:type II secretory pathway component PulF